MTFWHQIVILVSLHVPFAANAGGCLLWFQKSKLTPGPTCFASCAAIPTGMATFNCTLGCKEFCEKPTFTKNILHGLSQLYPSLTPAERAFASSKPAQALKAYNLSRSAEKICKKIFLTSDVNDESDACRHFVWAGLLRKELGVSTAKKVLRAHEEEPDQPKQEMDMDSANNNLGILNAERMIKKELFSEEQTLNDFVKELKAGHLIVIDRQQAPLEDLKP